ncbi:MAG: hypothetical protein LLG02_05060 [Pelosinus sp.]|nr:hypothetical protein [Pelosinus sp.]
MLLVIQAGNSNNTPVMAYCIKEGVMQPLIWGFSDTKFLSYDEEMASRHWK